MQQFLVLIDGREAARSAVVCEALAQQHSPVFQQLLLARRRTLGATSAHIAASSCNMEFSAIALHQHSTLVPDLLSQQGT
jgi:hypothetical protein